MRLQELIETKIKILSENKDSNVMNVMVPFIQSDIKNRNGRIYKKSLLQREIARVQNSVKKGSFIGVGDHPASGIENIATASHIVTALSLDEKGQGTAELRILPTPRGKTIQTLIRNNATLGVSIRGFGGVKGEVVQDDYKLMGLDIVTNPSFKNAVFDKSNIFESAQFPGEKEEKTPAEKLTEEQISARTHTYFLEAVQGGFIGSFDEWQKKFPQLVERAGEPRKIVEKKEEVKIPFKSKTTWGEVIQSGFVGTMKEYEEKFPNITIIKVESPQKPVVVEKTLKEQAAQIFTSLAKDNPNSQLTLEDIVKMLEKKEIADADQRLRKRAIFLVNTSLAGSGSSPSQEMLSKMVEEEIEDLKKKRDEMRERNWQAYERLLG